VRCEYASDDGAYVLGALAPAERAEYQRHLAGCQGCRDAVAELAVLPGLLGRLDATTAEQIAQAANATEVPGLPRLIAAAQQDRRRTRVRGRWRLGLAAAVVMLAFASGVVIESDLPRAPARELAMVPMAAVDDHSPVSAEVGFAPDAGGTKITLQCSYLATGDYHKPWIFRLFVVATDGVSEQVSSWQAEPGEELRVDTTTQYTVTELAKVELRLGDGTLLLQYALP
jgi:hypothetical protein